MLRLAAAASDKCRGSCQSCCMAHLVVLLPPPLSLAPSAGAHGPGSPYAHAVWFYAKRLVRLLAMIIDLCLITALVRGHTFDRRNHLRRTSSALAPRQHPFTMRMYVRQVAMLVMMLPTPAAGGNAPLTALGNVRTESTASLSFAGRTASPHSPSASRHTPPLWRVTTTTVCS